MAFAPGWYRPLPPWLGGRNLQPVGSRSQDASKKWCNSIVNQLRSVWCSQSSEPSRTACRGPRGLRIEISSPLRMVLFSGLGPDAQNQALFYLKLRCSESGECRGGSTRWQHCDAAHIAMVSSKALLQSNSLRFLAILAGRVSLKEGRPTYQRPAGADAAARGLVQDEDDIAHKK